MEHPEPLSIGTSEVDSDGACYLYEIYRREDVAHFMTSPDALMDWAHDRGYFYRYSGPGRRFWREPVIKASSAYVWIKQYSALDI